MLCTCNRCGKQFEAVHKTSVCEDCKTDICVICGKEFTVAWPYTQKTCSSKCRGMYRKESGISKQATEKASETLRMRYGVSNPRALQTLEPRKCLLCGEMFTPTSLHQLYCTKDHYRPCPICGKPVKVREAYADPICCSSECQQIKTAATCMDRYGCEQAVNSPHARILAKQHNLEKYGVEHYSQTDDYNAKYKQTCNDRYGCDYPLQNDAIRSKFIQTNISKYGGPSATCDEQVKQKAAETALRNYGGFGLASPELRLRIEATNLSKYGHIRPTQSDAVKEKTAQTCMRKFGARNWLQSVDRLAETVTDATKLDAWLNFKADPIKYLNDHCGGKININVLCTELGVTDSPIYDVLVQAGCSGLAHSKISKMENEVLIFLDSHNIQAIHNTRKVIPPQEVDIFVPSADLAIECNPTVTHNSTLADPWGAGPKSPSYHKSKSAAAHAVEITLFHIFSYEWTFKRPIVESMLLTRLGKVDRRVYARDTYVCELPNEECKHFLTANHLNGSGTFKHRLGLRLKSTDELVSVMTFNKMRKTIGIQDGSYELSRFCNLLNTSVVGGASKLFKHFVDEHPEISSIVSYSDVAHTTGGLYRTLGFTEEVHSDPNYVWINFETDVPVNRLNTQKANLKKFLHDDNIDLSKTERQIMIEHGYVQVFDSGTIRWRWTRS